MKRCPACRSQYTDDTLRFCLQDGTLLDAAPVDGFDQRIEQVDEQVTVVSEQPKATAADTGEAWTPNQRRNTGLIIFISILGTLLFMGILGVAALLFNRSAQWETARSTANSPAITIRTPESKPTATPAPTPTASPSDTPQPPGADRMQLSRELTRAIADWRSSTEALDAEELADKYAETVDYYRNRATSRDFVINDKERAFALYNSAQIEIGNIDVKPGATPDFAIVDFDKAWFFDGENRSQGKVRSRMSFRKVNGNWLITGENDIRVYR